MRQISMVIPAISCAHCKHTVETTLKQFDGVQEAIVDVANKRVALAYDPDKVLGREHAGGVVVVQL